MAAGHHVYCIRDLGSASKLDAALCHSNQEVVGVRDARGLVSCDVSRTDDRASQATSTCYTDELFGYPFALPVTGAKACSTT